MLTTLAISGYRSLRDVRLPLAQLNLVSGPNGSGKSSLYRALRLLADVAQGRVVQSLALEGGLSSTLWAGGGRGRKDPVSLKLGFAGEEYGYAIDLGYPIPNQSLFDFDPVVKAEAAWVGQVLRPRNVFAERTGGSVRIRDDAGVWRQALSSIAPIDTMMTHCADPKDAMELLVLRERMRAWRFYDHLRTDRDAPSRRPQVGTYTGALASDGADLAAAVQTIREVGDSAAFDAAIADAFPGAKVDVVHNQGWFEIEMTQPGLFRPLKAAELSEGTLRFLLLAAALLTPRPPKLMVLNEPEASLHTDLMAPLGRLIARASADAQIVVVSHAPALVEALLDTEGCQRFLLRKVDGETEVEPHDPPAWAWPAR